MRHLRFLLSVAIITMLSSSLLAQNSVVTYLMNGGGGVPVNLAPTNSGPLSLSATNFTPSVTGTAVAGSPFDPIFPSASNQGIEHLAVNWSFSFSVTNNTAGFGWNINDWGFDLFSASGGVATLSFKLPSSGTYTLLDTQPVTPTGVSWTSNSQSFFPALVLFPSATLDFRIDFTGFTTIHDIDQVFLSGGQTAAIPEPATIALMGLTGCFVAGGMYIRRRRHLKTLNASLSRV